MYFLINFLFIIISLLWFGYTIKQVFKYTNKNQKWSWFFWIFIVLIFLVLASFPIYGQVIYFYAQKAESSLTFFYTLSMMWATLWATIWICIFSKYLFHFIDFCFFQWQQENTKFSIFKIIFKWIWCILLSYCMLALIWIGVIYSLIICFQNLGVVDGSDTVIIATNMLMGLSTLWLWIWVAFQFSSTLVSLEKWIETKCTSKLKTVCFIVTSILKFILSYSLVYVSIIFALVLALKLISINTSISIVDSHIFMIWIFGIFLSIFSALQWFFLLSYTKNNGKFLVLLWKTLAIQSIQFVSLICIFGFIFR